jgi:cell filamentation protein
VADADPYIDSRSGLLANKLHITDARKLEKIEQALVLRRMAQPAPTGNFDLDHLCRIHKHLFQDVYEWAGEIRKVELQKLKDVDYLPRGRILDAMNYISLDKIKKKGFLRGLSIHDFADGAADIVGDINFLHPFREGNGRVQRIFISQLAEQAGHKIDWDNIDIAKWSLGRAMGAHGANFAVTKDQLLRGMAKTDAILRYELTLLLVNTASQDIEGGIITVSDGLAKSEATVDIGFIAIGAEKVVSFPSNWMPFQFSGVGYGANSSRFTGGGEIGRPHSISNDGLVKFGFRVNFVEDRDAGNN